MFAVAGCAHTRPPMETLVTGTVEQRRQAALDLQQLGPKAEPAIPVLVTAMRDADPELRLRAAQALGAIGKTKNAVVEALIVALRDENADVRRAAVDAFGRLDRFPMAAFPELIQKLGDKDSLVCVLTMSTFQTLGQLCTGALVKGLIDPDALVRHNVAMVLGTMGDESAYVKNALKRATLDKNAGVASAANRALERLKVD
jgi:HEAT repeat protein